LEHIQDLENTGAALEGALDEVGATLSRIARVDNGAAMTASRSLKDLLDLARGYRNQIWETRNIVMTLARDYPDSLEALVKALRTQHPSIRKLLLHREIVRKGTQRSAWAISWQGTGERPSRYRFVAINDNLLDDAVRSRRIALDIERQADDSWRVGDAQLSWRCWRKANDDSFGVDDCP